MIKINEIEYFSMKDLEEELVISNKTITKFVKLMDNSLFIRIGKKVFIPKECLTDIITYAKIKNKFK